MDTQPKSPASVNCTETNARLLERLLAAHTARLLAQARYHAPSEADAEDALQQACVQFLRHYREPAELEIALRWMMTVVKRCAWAIYRHAKLESASFKSGVAAGAPEQLTPLCPARRDTAELAEADAELRTRWAQLHRLKPDERRAILAIAFGFSYREVCERFRWSHTKLNRCLAEGRAALRAMAEEEQLG